MNYNYQISHITTQYAYDDRLAHLKYGFATVKSEEGIYKGVIITPNGNKNLQDYVHKKLEKATCDAQENNLDITIARLERQFENSNFLTNSWVVFGNLSKLKLFHELNKIRIFSDFGIEDFPKELKTNFSKLK